MRWSLVLVMSSCLGVGVDAGCTAYGEQRLSMPRPIENTPLGQWVAVTDSRLTGACR